MCSGGKAFVAVQGLGWVLFAASIASIIWLVIQVAAGVAYCVRCWALMTSSFFLSAELVGPCARGCTPTAHASWEVESAWTCLKSPFSSSAELASRLVSL